MNDKALIPQHIKRLRMAHCKCGGELVLGLELVDGALQDIDTHCPTCGYPVRGKGTDILDIGNQRK